MKGDIRQIYTSMDDFFKLGGSVSMKLTPEAAVDVCRTAAHRGLVIARVEGGIWHAPGFEARLDCIWDGADPPLSFEKATLNNELAAQFIIAEQAEHNAFILTAPPVSGWPHLQPSVDAPPGEGRNQNSDTGTAQGLP
jgi:hypothetical protein